MLSIGGWNPDNGANVWDTPDEWNYGIGILDLTSLTWGQLYNASSGPYVQSDPVQNYYITK